MNDTDARHICGSANCIHMSVATLVMKKALARPRCRSGGSIERSLTEMRFECVE